MMAELELLKILAEAENDVQNNRIAPISQSYLEIRKTLLEKK